MLALLVPLLFAAAVFDVDVIHPPAVPLSPPMAIPPPVMTMLPIMTLAAVVRALKGETGIRVTA